MLAEWILDDIGLLLFADTFHAHGAHAQKHSQHMSALQSPVPSCEPKWSSARSEHGQSSCRRFCSEPSVAGLLMDQSFTMFDYVSYRFMLCLKLLEYFARLCSLSSFLHCRICLLQRSVPLVAVCRKRLGCCHGHKVAVGDPVLIHWTWQDFSHQRDFISHLEICIDLLYAPLLCSVHTSNEPKDVQSRWKRIVTPLSNYVRPARL